jgi:D-tyrosyl-tRNA(Tyr) deacylase
MRAIVQRVKNATCNIDGKNYSSINEGILVLIGITHTDNDEILKWFANKLANLRIFSDENIKMNLSVSDIQGGIMLISNFTLYGDASKGFRPSYTSAAPPEISEKLYYDFVELMQKNYNLNIVSGVFGAMMDLDLINSGPVTVFIEKEAE